MSYKYKSLEEILNTTESAMGKQVKELMTEYSYELNKGKGNIGHLIETGLFNIDPNSLRAPDFENLGIELKVTGYRWVYKGTKVSAKERLVITMIDFFEDIKKDFYDTHLYEKIRKILLILYEYDNEKNQQDFLITNYYIYNFDEIPEKDKFIILKDFEMITDKIRNGLAHELSEGDTMYLGACPKGADSTSVRNQPFSDVPAMSRAYSLKTTYMTSLFRNHIFNEYESKEALIKDINLLKIFSIDEIINQIFQPYKNKTLTEIDELIGEQLERKNNKQLMKSYTSRMLKISEANYEHIEEFEKANIEIKTITLEANGNLREHMSFPAMDFEVVAAESWETSELKEFFETTKFLFVVFQKNADSDNNERVFKGMFLWNMPTSIINSHINQVWTDTNKILNDSIEIKIKNNRVYNNFPKQSQNIVSHVRPHGRLRSTTKPLPPHTTIKILENDGSVDVNIFFTEHRFTAMGFWLNKSYLLELIRSAGLV